MDYIMPVGSPENITYIVAIGVGTKVDIEDAYIRLCIDPYISYFSDKNTNITHE